MIKSNNLVMLVAYDVVRFKTQTYTDMSSARINDSNFIVGECGNEARVLYNLMWLWIKTHTYVYISTRATGRKDYAGDNK